MKTQQSLLAALAIYMLVVLAIDCTICLRLD